MFICWIYAAHARSLRSRLPTFHTTLPHPDPPHVPTAELDTLLAAVGCTIAKLHDGGLVHGDLTTSNMMVRAADSQLVSQQAGCG